MSSVARFDTWQAADGTNVARFASGELQVWNGAEWGAPPGLASVSGTTGSPTETNDGDATIYSFTGSGSITVSRAGFVDLLLVGGGGAGGGGHGGGGGAGGHSYVQNVYLPAGSHTVTVGGGGGAGIQSSVQATVGSASRLGSHLAIGGGVGGSGRFF